jgi:hypothetical protein
MSFYTNAAGREYRTWSPSSNAQLEVQIGFGSGQWRTPFTVQRDEFDVAISKFGFCDTFLRKIVGKTSLFEHHWDFDRSSPSQGATHLEVGVADYENDAFLIPLRHKIGTANAKSTKCLIFIKEMDWLKRTSLDFETFQAWLVQHQDLLERHPLLIVNVVLALKQIRAHEYVRWRQELNRIEARLGATRDVDRLLRSGYPKVLYDFNALNADLAGLMKRIADNKLSAETILEHAKAFQRVVGICENYDKAVETSHHSCGQLATVISEQREEIQSTITRAEIYLKHATMTQAVVQSLLYNRISQNDNLSMKTIAVVTLFFLPATFISAIFSTGIFNFHAGEPSDTQNVISRYSWVYLLTCLLSTGITLVAWLCWYRWGAVWLDKLRRKRNLFTKRAGPCDT